MSKLIITGVENGKISYIEGEEVNISVEEITEKVNSLREKISKAKENSLELLETEHLSNLNAVEAEFRAKIEELEKLRSSKINEEVSRYQEAKSHCISAEELQLLEKEESKLSVILEGLHEIDKPSESPEVEASEEPVEPVEEVKLEPTPVAEEEVVKEVSKPAGFEQQNLATVSWPKPRRIIF